MEYNKLTDEIIDNIGGVENVTSLSHCMTRLRFVLKDEGKADVEKLKNIKGVLGVVFGAGQLQIVMGKHVTSAYNEILKNYSFDASDTNKQKEETKPRTMKEGFLFILNFISGSVSPVISGLVAGGMLKLVLFVAIMLVPEWANVQSYKILAFVADIPFYFMPVFVAYGASKKLGCSPVYPMFTACILLHPTFITMVTEGDPIQIFGLPIMAVKYSSTMIPALLSTILVNYLEKFFNKFIPGIMKTVLVGACTIFTACIITLCVLGPIGMFIGNYLVGFIIWLQTIIGPFALAFLTAILPFMVMSGTHTLLAPFLVETLNINGYDTFFRPALILHVIAEGGAAIGVGLRTKNKELRSEAISLGIGSVFAGISEPVLYGVGLRYKRPLIGVMAGGAVGGLIAGFAGVKAYTMSKTTILAVPIFKETMFGMLFACIACLLVSAIVAYVLGVKEDVQKEMIGEHKHE